MLKPMTRSLALGVLLVISASISCGRDYFIHPMTGSDTNVGSLEKPLQSLAKIPSLNLDPGDTIALAQGHIHFGTLALHGMAGSTAAPIHLKSYVAPGESNTQKPIIDAKGHPNGILLSNCSHVIAEGIKIVADAGPYPDTIPLKEKMRCGVLVIADKPGDFANITLRDLEIQDVFFHEKGFQRGKDEVRTENGTQAYGWGIRVITKSPEAIINGVSIESCSVRNVSHTGIKLSGKNYNIRKVALKQNKVVETGGPGMHMSHVFNVHVYENQIDKSGSADDSRKWGRGSGLWTWSADNVLIERNQFRNASGPGDSAGCHIDYHCRNVIVQHNLSLNNAGGFCEILGDNYNCSYRYNISINDGHRTKGTDGAFQEGKVFWLSGYTGNKQKKKGPYNTYFYNNTIYVPQGNVAKISVGKTASGVLIANNIFHFDGKSASVKDDQYNPDQSGKAVIPNVVFKNNLYLNSKNWPKELPIRDAAPIYGDPLFLNKNGTRPADFTPQNTSLIKDKGIRIKKIPQDKHGLILDLQVKHDYFGNEITDLPDLGAIELPLKVDAPLQ